MINESNSRNPHLLVTNAILLLIMTLSLISSHGLAALGNGYGCLSGFGMRKCGYGCTKGFGKVECGNREGEACIAGFGKVVCGFNCVSKFGDIVCDTFPSDDSIVRNKQIRNSRRNKRYQNQIKDINACPEKNAPLNACDRFSSETILQPKHMGCTASGSHVWMCKGDDVRPPFPVIVCSSWDSDSCVKMSESW